MSRLRIDRREFIGLGGLLIFSSAAQAGVGSSPRLLSFDNLHTGEKLNTVYWADGEYVAESLADINRVLRDYRTGEIFSIDVRLLDALAALRIKLETARPFEVISGYRSPKTNLMLRNQSHGVAENSLHLKGMAADVRISSIKLSVLRQAAVSLRAGGVGYYPVSQFVHIDVGRVRLW